MKAGKAYLTQRGLFLVLYLDRVSHYTIIRHEGCHYDILSEDGDTQIQMVLEELGINHRVRSPQAKGRIE